MQATPQIPTIGWRLTLELSNYVVGPWVGDLAIDRYLDGDVSPVDREELFYRKLLHEPGPSGHLDPVDGALQAALRELLWIVGERQSPTSPS